ncbi:2,5-diamino-6-(ribosylamino)-4(3H)-pyrimidinone 5'-phosphate reductase [Saitoella coloradoensis]
MDSKTTTFLLPFFPSPQNARPYVTLTYAQSIDAKIAASDRKQLRLSGAESRYMTHRLRVLHEGILVGVGTAIGDDPGLNARLPDPVNSPPCPLSEQPRPFILDPTFRSPITPQTRLIRTAAAGHGHPPTYLVRSDAVLDDTKLQILQSVGGHVTKIPGTGALMWSDILKAVYNAGITSLMIEGGARVIADVLQQRAADAVIVTIAPVYVGKEGVGIDVDGSGGGEGEGWLKDVVWERFGGDVVLGGRMG